MSSKNYFKLLTITILIFFSNYSFAGIADHFVTTWKTDNPGGINSTSITIPTNGSFTYAYQVDWNGDEDFDDADENIIYTGDATFDYLSAGTYQIRIKGDFPAIQFGFSSETKKILSVDQWGTTQWKSMLRAFKDTSNMVINATDVPDLSITPNLASTFEGATLLGTGTGNWMWNTSAITNMFKTFNNTPNFNKDISSWVTANVDTMGFMFEGATVFNQDISGWDTSKVENMTKMFQNAIAFNQPIGSVTWDVSLVENFEAMFFNAEAFNQNISSWTPISATTMYNMFAQTIAFDQDIVGWNTANVTRMALMFAGSNYNSDISTLNTSKVTDMSNMFSNNIVFNQDIGSWDTSKVEDMSSMFFKAETFNQDISSWDTSSVLDMSSMFYQAKLFNQNIATNAGNWSTAQVTDMNGMFTRAYVFNQPIGNWNTVNVENMSYMFASASVFNQNIGSWNTISVTNMASMFSSAKDFNQDISGWNTAEVTNMQSMLFFLDDFDQNLGGWDVQKVTNFINMLNGTTLSNANYDALLIGWESQNLQASETFHAGNSKYCSQGAQIAKQNIMDNDNWSIIDGGLCNQSPVFTSVSTVDVDENETSVLTLVATDSDSSFLNFSISGGADAALFVINASDLLRFITPADFEANGSAANNNTYFVEVTVEDNGTPTESDVQLMTINVQDVADTVGNLSPTIISNGGGNNAIVNVDENQFSVTTVLATDPDGDDVEYSITGADSDKFSISLVTGIILFENAPDFETPGSAAGDNAYSIVVTATDNGTPIESDTQTITVNVNDLPEFISTDHFISTWKTDNQGSSNSTSITITTTNNVSNYQVDWNNDGDFDDQDEADFHTGTLTHDFGSAGTYQIRIQGEFAGLDFNNAEDKDKLLSIDQWGTSQIRSMDSVFYGASNLVINATDTPDLSLVTNLYRAFKDATNLGNGMGNWHWNTSTITNMGSLFEGATAFNQDITQWDTSNVIHFSDMFNDASLFNQDISGWDTALVLDMIRMFKGAVNFNQNLASWDMGNSGSLDEMFLGATLSTSNYDALLIGWNQQDLLSSTRFHAGNSKYCSQAAQDARENMDNQDNWFINDGGITNSCFNTIDLDVSITDNTETVDVGGNVIYTIIVKNIANGDAQQSSVTDLTPAEITNTTWTCSPAAGSTCTATGVGDINDTVDIQSGSRVTYTLNATLSTDNFSQVIYSVEAQPSLIQTDIDPNNNLAIDVNLNSDIVFANGFD